MDVVDEALARIDAANGELNAFVHVDAELARREAARVDATVAAGGDPGPLAGVPFGVKDLEDCAGLPTSQGSLLFKGRPPVARDSIHVARMRAAGAVPVGKTAAPEFGTLQYTRTKASGVTRNPWDLRMTPGGSSGGSAAAVAAGLTPICTASDGGGSTRIPAAFIGLVGFKASFGRVPGEHGMASQTAVLGALTTTVADAARHLDVVAGPDDRDRTTLPAPGLRYEDVIERLDVGGLRAVWSSDLGFAAVDPEVAAIAESAARRLIDAAALRPVEHAVRLTDPVRVWLSSGSVDLWVTIEADHWPARAADLTPAPLRTLQLTGAMTVPRLASAYQRRWQLEDEVAELFETTDVVLTPTTAVAAFAAEGPPPTEIAGRKVDGPMSVPFTMLANLCWNPAVSVPAGVTAAGLPVGLQVMARRHADDVVLRLARLFEQTCPWPRLAPGRG